jgi:maltose-binding protein MalE
MKRALLLLPVLVLSGCVASQPPPTSITLDVPQAKQQIFAGVIEQFESDTGLEVILIDSSTGSLEPADLIYTDSTALDGLISQGRVVELDRDLASGLIDGAVATFTRDEKLYGVPFNFETVSLVCHKEKVNGQPQSWEELLSLGFLPTYTPGNAFESLFYLSSFQTESSNLQSLVLDESAATNLASWLIQQRGIFTVEDYSTVVEDFSSRKSSCLVAGPWMASPMAEFDLVALSLPQIGSSEALSPALSLGLALSASSENQEGAKSFLRLLATKEAQRDIYEVTGVLPATAAFSSEITNPLLRALIDSKGGVFPVPNLSNSFVELVALEELITDSLESEKEVSEIYAGYLKKLGEG